MLTGFKGCGKTTIGKRLSRHLGYEFFDTDSSIEKLHFQQKGEHLSYPEIFQKYGNSYFRKLEGEILASLADLDHAVIALGGGSFWAERPFRPDPKTQFVVFIRVNPDVLFRRITKKRIPPLFLQNGPENARSQFDELILQRTPVYSEFAELIVDNDSSEPEQTVLEILDRLPFKNERK